jgi:adenylate cyclase
MPDGTQRAMVFAQPSDGPPWIAVLPFRTSGPDPVPGYFATGLVEDIVCMLATLREPIVISANSTLSYHDQPIDLRRIGQELGARYLASGSIRKSGNWLRIAVELAEAGNGMVLWAQYYDIDSTHLFDVQDSIVAKIVGTWIPRLHEAELRRVRAKRPENMTAYDLVLQARDLVFRLTRDAFEDAARFLTRAISLDPAYAAAHALMADLLNLRVGQGWSLDIAADAQAVDLMAQQAISSDPFNAKALAIYGHNRSYLYRDYDTAVKLFDRTLEAAPNDANGWMWSASTYAYIGDGPGAVMRAERALRLSPKDPFLFRYYTSLCLAHYTNGSFEEAVHWGRLGLQEFPNYTANLRFTTAALVELGRVDEARDMARPVMAVQPEFRVQDVIDRHPYRDLDRRMRIAQALIKAGLPE